MATDPVSESASADPHRPDDDTAWDAVMRRDWRYDGRFVTGVLTTGIYCRPSCAARHPARHNVRFFDDGPAARSAGLRPCKRCLPDAASRDAEAVAIALKALDDAEESLSLGDLAGLTGYSPTHFQKLFKRRLGVSPAAYGRALRLKRSQRAMADGASVTRAIYEGGFGSASQFYDIATRKMGMTASVWKNGGQGARIARAEIATAVGPVVVGLTEKGLCWLSFGDDMRRLEDCFPNADIVPAGQQQEALIAQVMAAVDDPALAGDLPLDVRGTAFQEAVWQALAEIPSGETRSYAEIAAAIGRPKAVRAVGSACGANPVAVAIPCHRALRTDGSLGGYAYGLAIKRDLLDREGR